MDNRPLSERNPTLAALLANRPTFNTTFTGGLSQPVGGAGSRQLGSATPGTSFDFSQLLALRSAPDALTAQAGLESVLGAIGFGLTAQERDQFAIVQRLRQPFIGTAFDFRTFLPS